jgi:beta-lactamase regulating signal transducer with metallopeptidase domain
MMETLERSMEAFVDSISWYLDAIESIVVSLAATAGSAALLAAIVAVISVCARRWLTAAQAAALWGLVLVRLALPIVPASSFSTDYLWQSAKSLVVHQPLSEPPHLPPILVEWQAPQVAETSVSPQTAAVPVNPSPQPVSSVPPTDSSTSATPAWEIVLLAVALAIVVLLPVMGPSLLLWTCVAHARLRRSVRRHAATTDRRVLEIWKDCQAIARIRRPIPVVISPEMRQPAVMGALAPTLLLPEEALDFSDSQLRLIMLHELAHVRQGDLFINWLLVALKAAHWWNPVYWFAVTRFRALREQACDAYALTRSAPGAGRELGELLLHFSDATPRSPHWLVFKPVYLLGLSSRQHARALKRRIISLRTANIPPRPWQRGIVATLLVALAMCGWTEAKTAIEQPHRFPWPPTSIKGGFTWEPVLPVRHGPMVSLERDLTAIMNPWREGGVSEEQAVAELESLLALHLKTLSAPAASSDEAPTYQIEGTTLKLTASGSTVAEVGKLLDVWEKFGASQISVECRFITAPFDLASTAGVGWQSISQTDGIPVSAFRNPHDGRMAVGASAARERPLPVCMAALDDRHASGFIQAVQGPGRASICFAPKITVFNGSLAGFSDLVSEPFITGIEEQPDGTLAPKIQIFDLGTRFAIRVVADRDGRRTRLEGQIDVSDIAAVKSFSSKTKNGREATIQIPEVNHIRIHVDSEITDEESLLIGCLPSYDRSEFLYLMITPRVIKEIDQLGEPLRRGPGPSQTH